MPRFNLILVLSTLFLALSGAVNIPQKCLEDSDCPVASFCDHVSLMCETCLPCESLLNRVGTNCARAEENCGVCLPGYQSEELTGQRRSYMCYPVLIDKQFEMPSNTSSSMLTTWATSSTIKKILTGIFTGIFVTIIKVAIIKGALVLKRRYCMKRKYGELDPDDPESNNNVQSEAETGVWDRLKQCQQKKAKAKQQLSEIRVAK